MKKLAVTCILLSSLACVQVHSQNPGQSQGQVPTSQFWPSLSGLLSLNLNPFSNSKQSTEQIANTNPAPYTHIQLPPKEIYVSPDEFRKLQQEQNLRTFPRGAPAAGRSRKSNTKIQRTATAPIPNADLKRSHPAPARATEKKFKKKKKKNPEMEEEDEDELQEGEFDDEDLKEFYKLSFYENPGWYAQSPETPSGPGPVYSSEYFPNPQYGALYIQHLPPPLPKPLSKSISLMVSNFGGYVGPIVYDNEEGLVFDHDRDKEKN